MQEALQVIGSVIFIYSLLIAIRIILSWFHGGYYGRAWDLLVRATEPYLRIFRGIRFLRVGQFDFSPIAAILVLVVLQNIIVTLASYGTITLGLVLAIIIQAVWGSFVWLLFFFLILSAIRLGGLYLTRNPSHPFWHTLDMLVHPVVAQVNRLFRATLDYSVGLMVTIGLLVATWLVGGFIVGFLVRQLSLLPI